LNVAHYRLVDVPRSLQREMFAHSWFKSICQMALTSIVQQLGSFRG